MRIGELVSRAGVSIKAVRYYEQIGLITPLRTENGYRSFDDAQLRTVAEIRTLNGIGIAPHRAGPFIECLETGHEHSDECVSSLAVYRDTIQELDHMITDLSLRRDELQRRLEQGAGRTFETGAATTDYTILPEGLPVPRDDGAADHLRGQRMPELELPTSDGRTVRLHALGAGRTVIYLYPLTGRPGVDLPAGWDEIPGARGCSTQACDFRDHFDDLRGAGADQVFGLSSQDPAYQAEVVQRLSLPFAMISDASLTLADVLRLPTFAAPGHERLFVRLTLIVLDGMIEHAFHPIFPPNTHAQQVLTWLGDHPGPD